MTHVLFQSVPDCITFRFILQNLLMAHEEYLINIASIQ